MLALIIFALTLFGILRRPFGLGVWVYSSVGAVFVLVFKLVSVSDLYFIFSLIWDSSLTLIGLIIISLCLEALGFFERLIFYTLRLCQNATNSSHNLLEKNTLTINTQFLFIIICLLCALCSSILANDGAILIFTPLVLGLFLRAKRANLKLIIAFLFAVSFICDISSNPLIISNLTNIITANFHQITLLSSPKLCFCQICLPFCALYHFFCSFFVAF